MTVKQLSAEMSSSELTEWMAYDRLDPIGGYRQDIQTAHLLFAKFGDKDKSIADFLPVDPNPMTAEQRVGIEKQKQIAELQAQTDQMMLMFESM